MALTSAFDVLCVEAEHSPLGRADVDALVRTISLTGLPCLVRVASHQPAEIAAALDAGAAGIIVPRVESRPEAERVCQAAHFPPRGVRGIGPSRATAYGRGIERYRHEALAQTLVCLQIETRQGVMNLNEILSVSGVDLIFVGPGDLAGSLGMVGGDGVDLRREVAKIRRKSTQADKLAGIYASTLQEANRYFRQGFDLVIVGSDLHFLNVGIQREIGARQRPISRRSGAR